MWYIAPAFKGFAHCQGKAQMNALKTALRRAWMLAPALLIAACATGDNPEFDQEDDEEAPPVVEDHPCGQDCSLIEAPQCFHSICNEASGNCEVVPIAEQVECDDGLFCTTGDACQAGECIGGAANTCGLEHTACDEVQCVEVSQTCTLTPIPDGGSCTPTDLCQSNGICSQGQCLGEKKDCLFHPVPNECHVAACDPMDGQCKSQTGNEGLSCIDSSDLCMTGKTCSAGSCVGGSPMDCSFLTQGCFEGVCDSTFGQCDSLPIPAGGSCSAAADDCNTGECDTSGICQPVAANEGLGCEDGDPCTANEICSAGTCGGGAPVAQTIFFSEDFSDNTAGWTLDTEWGIGSAVSSASTGSCGMGDPGTDHTEDAIDPNNGIAGAAIGGNITTAMHPYYYLTSPTFDASAAQGGTLWVGFERWLNSDYTPYMDNTVEVWDGTDWVTVWNSGAGSIQDLDWTHMLYDIGAYANANMRVRIGFNVDSTSAYTCSGWNLDDMVVANVVCNPTP